MRAMFDKTTQPASHQVRNREVNLPAQVTSSSMSAKHAFSDTAVMKPSSSPATNLGSSADRKAAFKDPADASHGNEIYKARAVDSPSIPSDRNKSISVAEGGGTNIQVQKSHGGAASSGGESDQIRFHQNLDASDSVHNPPWAGIQLRSVADHERKAARVLSEESDQRGRSGVFERRSHGGEDWQAGSRDSREAWDGQRTQPLQHRHSYPRETQSSSLAGKIDQIGVHAAHMRLNDAGFAAKKDDFADGKAPPASLEHTDSARDKAKKTKKKRLSECAVYARLCIQYAQMFGEDRFFVVCGRIHMTVRMHNRQMSIHAHLHTTHRRL